MFGDRVKSLRKERKITQGDLAQAIGITQGFISDIERGKTTPGSDILLSLSRYFEVNPNWLLKGEGEMLAKGGSKTQGHIDPTLAQEIAKKLKTKYQGKTIELTGEELMAVQMLRDLSDHDRQRIMHTLQMAWTAAKVDS